ncbi:MAG: hypothetical protein ABSB88_10035 [Bryobacteraceae bacterium]|jgi:hypothetical protein
MNCREYRNSLMEWARGNPPAPEVVSHLEECPPCARFLDEQRALSAALASLAAEPLPPAEQFQARVMAEFGKVQPARRPVLRWVLAGALAASVILGAVWSNRSVPAPAPVAEEEPGFLPIPYTVPLSPQERATVWRMEIPVARLRAVGYRVQVSDPGAVVEADVLVGQDGRAHAIRPLTISSSN